MDGISTLIFQGAAIQSAEVAALVLEQAEAGDAVSSLAFVQAVLESGGEPNALGFSFIHTVDRFISAVQHHDVSSAKHLQRVLAGQIRPVDDSRWQRVFIRTSLHFSFVKEMGVSSSTPAKRDVSTRPTWVRMEPPEATIEMAVGWIGEAVWHRKRGNYRQAAPLYKKAGLVFEAKGKLKRARDAYWNAAFLYRAFHHHKMAGQMDLKAARLDNRLKHFVAAVVGFSRAIFMFQEAGVDSSALEGINVERLEAFQRAVGTIRTTREGLRKGGKVLLETAKIHEAAGENRLAAQDHDRLASSFVQLGENFAAHVEYSRSAHLLLEVNAFREVAEVLEKQIFLLEREQRDPKGIGMLYWDAADYFEKGGDRKSAAEMYAKYGEIMSGEMEFLPAAEAFDKAHENFQAVGKEKEALWVLERQAFCLDKGGEFEKASRLWEKIAVEKRKRGDKLGMAKAWSSSGLALRKLGRWEGAVHALEKAAVILEEIGALDLAAPTYGLVSFILEGTRRVEESGHFWDRAVDILLRTGNIVHGEAEMFYTLGEIFDGQGEYGEAIKMFTRAAFRFEEVNKALAATAYEAVGKMELKLGRFGSAIKALRKAGEYFKIGGVKKAVKRIEGAIHDASRIQ